MSLLFTGFEIILNNLDYIVCFGEYVERDDKDKIIFPLIYFKVYI